MTKSHRTVDHLVSVVQELSLVRDLETAMAIVCRSARELTGADGATFVLREGESCYYSEENTIRPLWKGQRFPIEDCISGWAMLNRRPVIIKDIPHDPRPALDNYRRTFVKSLAIVPIRAAVPVGAIGVYWAISRNHTVRELRVLEALAESTSTAMENVQRYAELQKQVREQAVQLESLNSELESFSFSIGHDLRAPLRHVLSFASLLETQSEGRLDDKGQHYLHTISDVAGQMDGMIKGLIAFSRVGRTELQVTNIDLNRLVQGAIESLIQEIPEREILWRVADLPEVRADVGLLQQVYVNLIGNAIKFTRTRRKAVIEIGCLDAKNEVVLCVRDNGVGFNMQNADRLFGVFQRLHDAKLFEGSGVGLAIVRRIIAKHGGRTWAESSRNKGATFYFTLPKS